VAPLTAGVLAAVSDADLGEASAINDAASRVGGVVVIALVPVLLRAGTAGDLGQPLAHGYRTAMLAMAGLTLAAAAIAALFVSQGRLPVPQWTVVTPRVSGCAVRQLPRDRSNLAVASTQQPLIEQPRRRT
jgi:hypothetical protein